MRFIWIQTYSFSLTEVICQTLYNRYFESPTLSFLPESDFKVFAYSFHGNINHRFLHSLIQSQLVVKILWRAYEDMKSLLRRLKKNGMGSKKLYRNTFPFQGVLCTYAISCLSFHTPLRTLCKQTDN